MQTVTLANIIYKLMIFKSDAIINKNPIIIESIPVNRCVLFHISLSESDQGFLIPTNQEVGTFGRELPINIKIKPTINIVIFIKLKSEPIALSIKKQLTR